MLYQHTDALGTPIAVTDVNKALAQTSEYEPYGQLLNRTLTDGVGFTGHVQDAATGLTYMQQRYYDPAIGASLSVDPVTAYDNGDMRFFNRYAYAFNNPYRFTDPDGRQSKENDEGNFWVGVFKGVRDNVAPLAHAMVDPDGTMIDPSYDRVGPGEGKVEQGGYKFGGALATAEGLKIPAKGSGGLVKSEVALTEAQAKNLARFEKKLPAGNTGATVTQTGESVTFTSEVPGRVPGSKAIYEKGVDASGTTTSMQKTTVAPNGQVIHVKDKLN